MRWYKGYQILKSEGKTPGEYGLWYVPDLCHRQFANKIIRGFYSVSIIQCKEAIDEWFDFNIKVLEFKK